MLLNIYIIFIDRISILYLYITIIDCLSSNGSNKLILLGAIAYPWIKMKLGNRERNYFWSSNWSPFGRIRNYLRSEPSSSLGIASNSTLSELWERDHWVLPAARSENQVRIFSHLTSLTISDHQDQFDWCPNDLPSEKYFTKLI